MSVLYVQVFNQRFYDSVRSVQANQLNFVATEFHSQPAQQYIFDYGTTNASATPYPIFATDDLAITHFTTSATTILLDDVNGEFGFSFYSSCDIEKVPAPVGAAIMSLTFDSFSDGSTNKAYTATEKTKLATLAAVAVTGAYSDLTGAPSIPSAQVNTDWNSTNGVTQLTNKPTLATVATSGSYTDLSSKPSIPAAQVQVDWSQVSSGSIDFIKNKPSLSTVATTGAYTDLSGKPSLATVATTGAYSDLTGSPNIPVVQAYNNATQRLGAFPIFASSTVATGVAVFYLTTDGTSTGTAIFPNSVITDSVNVTPNDSTALYGLSWAFTNSNKTLTVTVNKSSSTGVISLLGLNLLGSPIAAANGTTVKLQVWGY